PLIRVIHELHGGAWLAGLLARPPLPPLPQRPVPRLLLIPAVRRRRPRGIRGIPADLPLQLLHPHLQPLRLAGQLRDQLIRPASRSASSACGSADSSSADGIPGTSGTAPQSAPQPAGSQQSATVCRHPPE